MEHSLASRSSRAWHRFLFVRDKQKKQRKGVLQLDMFEPHDFDFRYKVIVTNKTTQAKNVVEYHEGRGTQEGLFAELKTEAAMSYVPCNSWNANKLFLLSNVFAHNLTRELQMHYRERDRTTTVKRPDTRVYLQYSHHSYSLGNHHTFTYNI